MHREPATPSAAAGNNHGHGHGHGGGHGTPTNTYIRGPSVDNQSNVLDHVDSIDSVTPLREVGSDDMETAGREGHAGRQLLVPGQTTEDQQQLLQRDVSPQPQVQSQAQPQQRLLPLSVSASSQAKQRRFAQQRSILKNSQERTFVEENEVLEAKKQLILRRRRLFSHYRQYDQWRRRQFSYDPSYFRPPPLPSRPLAYADYGASGMAGTAGIGINIGGMGMGMGAGGGAGAGVGVGYNAANAGRRRRQYRRQYSCADRSRDGSRESRGSSTLQLQKYHSMVASDTIHTESSMLNHSNYSEPASVSAQNRQMNLKPQSKSKSKLKSNNKKRSFVHSFRFVRSLALVRSIRSFRSLIDYFDNCTIAMHFVFIRLGTVNRLSFNRLQLNRLIARRLQRLEHNISKHPTHCTPLHTPSHTRIETPYIFAVQGFKFTMKIKMQEHSKYEKKTTTVVTTLPANAGQHTHTPTDIQYTRSFRIAFCRFVLCRVCFTLSLLACCSCSCSCCYC